ncbi:antitoxin HipB [mine drainage metagenome]|uniref:Antitoxin HipB n=1 Tax=mine drainage metagenome TaxID=410659 RepID=A0A1J5SJV5_9ZZZZ
MKEFFNRLKLEFSDKEYAHSYMESHAVSRLAAQIYALRKQRGWSQEKLAAETGIAQETISKIESANFNSLTMTTLHKFSKAFDVNLSIAFEPFSRGIVGIANMNPEQLKVESREADLESSLSEHTYFLNSGGEWKAVNHLSVVAAVTSIQPLTPNDEWQSLGVPQESVELRA